jgi:5-methylcytosine-specific restriction endonuclease McrBC GTP-binding regulatory subunit McrB
LSKSKEYGAELAEEYLKASGNSQLLKTAETMKFEFGQDVLQSLLDATSSNSRFELYLKELNSKGILDMDDFTLVYFKG